MRPRDNRAGRRWRTAAGPLPLLALLCLLSGCATYSAKMADLRPQVAAGDFDGALATVEEHAGGKDAMLVWLERGLLHHYADRYVESNAAFVEAELLAESLYGTSLAEGALSLISNDNAIAYRARPFELALVPYFKALNYAYLEDRGAAVVEARRASQLLAQYIDATLSGVREEDRSGLEQVRSDAFLLYFSGMLYDWDGEINDAFIAYRNAAVAFQQNAALLDLEVPPTLAGDLARTADRLGFAEELARTVAECPDVFGAVADTTGDLRLLRRESRWPAGRGEVVVLVETGFVPQKEQVRFDFPVFAGDDYDDKGAAAWMVTDHYGNLHVWSRGRKIEQWVAVAAPELRDDVTGPYRGVRLSAGTVGGLALGARAANVARQARVTFDAEKPTILFRTILRGLTKYLATRGAEKAGGKTVGFLANVLGVATESADTRSWLTLPEHIHVVRVSLPPGRHDLKLELLDANGRVGADLVLEGVEVRAGEWTFVSRRIF